MEPVGKCGKTEKHPETELRGAFSAAGWLLLALTGLHARIFLVDYVNAAMAAHDAAVLVAELGRFQAVADLHDTTFGPGDPD